LSSMFRQERTVSPTSEFQHEYFHFRLQTCATAALA
jgi:hypothetical protein